MLMACCCIFFAKASTCRQVKAPSQERVGCRRAHRMRATDERIASCATGYLCTHLFLLALEPVLLLFALLQDLHLFLLLRTIARNMRSAHLRARLFLLDAARARAAGRPWARGAFSRASIRTCLLTIFATSLRHFSTWLAGMPGGGGGSCIGILPLLHGDAAATALSRRSRMGVEIVPVKSLLAGVAASSASGAVIAAASRRESPGAGRRFAHALRLRSGSGRASCVMDRNRARGAAPIPSPAARAVPLPARPRSRCSSASPVARHNRVCCSVEGNRRRNRSSTVFCMHFVGSHEVLWPRTQPKVWSCHALATP